MTGLLRKITSPRSGLICLTMYSRRVNHQVASAAPATPNNTPIVDLVIGLPQARTRPRERTVVAEHRLEQYRSHVAAAVLLIRRFLDLATCGVVRAGMDAGTADPAEVLDAGIGQREDVRRAASIDVEPSVLDAVECQLDAARDQVSAFFGIALTGREGAGFLRYGPGGFYRPHRDRAEVAAWPGAARRRVTAVVFLNSTEFTGGVLRVGGQPVIPETGMLAAFLAETVHEVTPVYGGVRDTVVDWYLADGGSR